MIEQTEIKAVARLAATSPERAAARDAMRSLAQSVENFAKAETTEAMQREEKRIESQIARVSDASIMARIEEIALGLSCLRKLINLPNIHSSKKECDQDWFLAKTVLMLDVIERQDLDLTHIEASCYPLFDGVWLDDIQRVKAYYIWKASDFQKTPQDYYFAACQDLRKRLLDPEAASKHAFDSIQRYLEQNVLGKDGKLDDAKKTAHETVKSKAHRLFETTRVTDETRNWELARLYTAMFYENIIPAVTRKDRQSTIAVLQSLQFGKSAKRPYCIINAFESVVAVEFLHKPLVNTLVEDKEACTFSIVPVDDWPAHCALPAPGRPGRFRHDARSRQIMFSGIMGEGDKDILAKQLHNDSQRAALDELYEQTRMGPFRAMIL
jgi:hypothetical protein